MGHKNRKYLDNSYLPTQLSAWAQLFSRWGVPYCTKLTKNGIAFCRKTSRRKSCVHVSTGS